MDNRNFDNFINSVNVEDEIDRLIELDKIEKLVKAKVRIKSLGPRRRPLSPQELKKLENRDLEKSGLKIKRIVKEDLDTPVPFKNEILNITRGAVSGMGKREVEATRKWVLNNLRKFLDQDLDEMVREEGPIETLIKTNRSAADFAISEHWEGKERGPDWELDQWLHENKIEIRPFKKFLEDWEEETVQAEAMDSQQMLDSIDEFIKEMNRE